MAGDTVELIKNKLSVIDVVGEYVKLTKSGRNFKGLSPFNKEKTPSFYVSPDRGSYYCFSSNQGGDIFTFIEKMEGVDFKGALKILADKAGVPLSEYSKKDTGKIDALRGALQKAQDEFVATLTKDSEAYAYAIKRGLTENSIQQWGLGFAKDGWRNVLEKLSSQNIPVPVLLSAGLVKEADEKPGTYYDRFRNRLMFPITDSSGRVIAFTGRALDPDDNAKYLNSPETDVFKKSDVLYGFHLAKDAIRKRGFAILTEGQFDVILLHQIGFENAVAVSGTALTDAHVRLITRYTENLMLALDADRAGRAATFKHAQAALALGMRVKVVSMPAGLDPADLASSEPKEFAKRVKEAKHVALYFLDLLSQEESDPQKLIKNVETIVLPLIALLKSPLEQDHLMQDVARTLSLSVESVRASLPQTALQKSPRVPLVSSDQVDKMTVLENTTARLVALRALLKETELAKMIEEEYTQITGRTLPHETSSERLLFEAETAYTNEPTEDDVRELLRAFHKEFLHDALTTLTKELRSAELANRHDDVENLLQQSTALTEQLRHL